MNKVNTLINFYSSKCTHSEVCCNSVYLCAQICQKRKGTISITFKLPYLYNKPGNEVGTVQALALHSLKVWSCLISRDTFLSSTRWMHDIVGWAWTSACSEYGAVAYTWLSAECDWTSGHTYNTGTMGQADRWMTCAMGSPHPCS